MPGLEETLHRPLDGWGQGPKRIRVPLDGSELAESVRPRVEALARLADARLTLLQVIGLVVPEPFWLQGNLTSRRRNNLHGG